MYNFYVTSIQIAKSFKKTLLKKQNASCFFKVKEKKNIEPKVQSSIKGWFKPNLSSQFLEINSKVNESKWTI